MTPAPPILSIVAAVRNDGPPGPLQRQVQRFLDALLAQCQAHDLPAEVILVAWGAPSHRPGLAAGLRLSRSPEPCRVRILEVPADCSHESGVVPILSERVARNAGIRRASAPFVLCTRVDVLFSDELIRFIQAGGLQPGRLYRIDRQDVCRGLPTDRPTSQQLAWCREHLSRVYAREGTFALTRAGLRLAERHDIVSREAGIHFGSGWHPPAYHAGELVRWVEQTAEIIVQVPAGEPQALCLELEPGAGVGFEPFRLQVRDTNGQPITEGQVECRSQVELALPLVPGEPGRFTLHVEGGHGPAGEDPRLRNYGVYRCAWAPLGAPAPAGCHVRDIARVEARDIVPPGVGVRFGRGWHRVEFWENQPYRWVSSDAVLELQPPPGGPLVLCLEMKPGPGVSDRPFVLQVLDEAGRIAAQGRVGAKGAVRGRGWHSDDRQRVYLRLLAPPGQATRFRLRVLGAEPVAAAGVRPRHFCVYHCRWVNSDAVPAEDRQTDAFRFRCEELAVVEPSDVVPGDGSIRLGQGWYPLEQRDGQPLRWAAHEANLYVRPLGRSVGALSLELKAGPGVGFQPFDLLVLGRSGQVVARGRVPDADVSVGDNWPRASRQMVALRLPLAPGQTESFTLRVAGGGQPTPTPHDARTLAFCLWRCAWLRAADDGSESPAEGPFAVTPLQGLAPVDIVPRDGGIRLGRGWSAVEAETGGPRRWAGEGAELWLQPPFGRRRALLLELEPGPGVRRRPFWLEVRNRAGRVITRGWVAGPARVALWLPGVPGQVEKYTLHTDGAWWQRLGTPCDRRFQVSRCSWAAPLDPANAPVAGPVSAACAVELLGPQPSRGRRLRPRLWWQRWSRRFRVVSAAKTLCREPPPLESATLTVPAPEPQAIRAVACSPAPSPVAAGPAASSTAGPAREPILGEANHAPAPAASIELHTNACADFLLMAREHWLAIRGFPEQPGDADRLAALTCYLAHHAGAREEILAAPLRLYGVAEREPEAGADPAPDEAQLRQWIAEMRRHDRPLLFNDASWGLAGRHLRETVLSPATATQA
jgi:catechol 2,3-dioxygenase-like lactoylglutathione lyase family enzyme